MNVSVKPFQRRYLALTPDHKRTAAEIMGYNDCAILEQVLGIRRRNRHEPNTREVQERTALRLLEALDLDPVDVGL